MSEITDRIHSRGHWDVAIRPEPFAGRRIDYGDLEDVMTGAVVRLRGWPVPYIDHREDMLRGEDWIGQDVAAQVVPHTEAWRFFQSGQFSHLRAVEADWRAGAEATTIPDGSNSVIEIWEILFYLTEVYELAARLALGSAGDERMTVDVQLHGLENRALVVGTPRRVPFSTPHRATTPSLRQKITLARDELVAEPREKAVETAREFFMRFGWQPSLEQLAEQQRELTERS